MTRIAFVTAALLATSVTARAATDPVVKCHALKIKAAGNKTLGEAKCHQKAVLKGQPVDSLCIAKAEGKFASAIAKADAAGACPGSATTLEAAVDQCVSTYLAALCAAGTPVGGFCWFLGAATASCDATCTAQGLAYDAATDSYAGNGGTDEQCRKVTDALGITDPFATDIDCNTTFGTEELGCGWDQQTEDLTFRCHATATTSSATSAGVQRVCACK
jgi:hypothetical protein